MPEPAKHRARFILWPKGLNDASRSDYDAQFTLQTARQQVEAVNSGLYSFALDLAASFYQILLPQEARKFYVFKVGNQKYWPTRMQMGARESPEIMQRVCEYLARPPGHLHVAVSVHVDNIRVVGDRESVVEMLRIVAERAALYGVQFNEQLSEELVTQQNEYCGFAYDYAHKTVGLGAKLRTKLAAAAQLHPITRRDVLHICGLVMFVSRALGVPLARKFALFKFLRTVAKDVQCGCQLDDPISVPDAIVCGLQQWAQELRDMGPQFISLSSPAVAHLYTDASKSGWGAVLLRADGAMHVAGARWTAADRVWSVPINRLEVQAVVNAFGKWPDLLRGTVKLFVDNVAAKATIQRGYSRVQALNSLVGSLHDRLSDGSGTVLSVSYVPSLHNPADLPSRASYDYSYVLDARSGGWERSFPSSLAVKEVVQALPPVGI